MSAEPCSGNQPPGITRAVRLSCPSHWGNQILTASPADSFTAPRLRAFVMTCAHVRTRDYQSRTPAPAIQLLCPGFSHARMLQEPLGDSGVSRFQMGRTWDWP